MSKSGIIGFVDALFTVYIFVIIARALLSFLPQAPRGGFYVIYKFVFDVTEPYLRIFRRFIPPTSGIDFSPMIAIMVLWLVRYVVLQLIVGM